jgi:hypothetical protein
MIDPRLSTGGLERVSLREIAVWKDDYRLTALRLRKRVFESLIRGAIRFSIRRIVARSIIVSEVCTRYS